jgi:hypothetical protein
MPKKRSSAEQTVTLLRQIEVLIAQGQSAPEVMNGGLVAIDSGLIGEQTRKSHVRRRAKS